MKNARKSILKALISIKEIYTAMFLDCVPLCAASLFKMLSTECKFSAKIEKMLP